MSWTNEDTVFIFLSRHWLLNYTDMRKKTFTPKGGFTRGTLFFTNYNPAGQRYSPCGMVITESRNHN